MAKHRGALPLQMSQAAGRTTACTRRVTARCPTAFGLMYAGPEENGEVTIGDGAVVNLSPGGLGIRGNQPVPVGMELMLFLYLPDGEEPLFTVQGRVVWSQGRRFGVEFSRLNAPEGRRLRAFLLTCSSR